MDALTIHEAAETTGWSPRMLRYVERVGLVEPARSSSGYRLYGPAELQRLDYSQLGLGVTLTFSLKESLFKALYPLTRQRFYFEHAELLEWSVEGYARLRLLTDLSADWQAGRELEGQFCVQDGYLLSLINV